jgi:hypothetical protein
MERFGGWVKRQAVHNRKLPIEALNNRVLQEEEVCKLPIQEASSDG